MNQSDDPLFTGDFARRTMLALRSVSLTMLVVMPLILLVTIPVSRPLEIAAMAALSVVALLVYLLARAGRLRPALMLLVAAIVAYGIAGVMAYGSIRGVATMAFVGAIVVGGLFFGRAALIGLVLFCAAALGVLVLAERSGLLPPPNYAVTPIHWLVHVAVLAAIALNIHYARSLMLAALGRSERDLRERDRAEQARGEAEDAFGALFGSSPAALMITRLADQRIADLNRSYEEAFGWSRDEAIGRTSQELAIWESARERDAFMEETRAGAPQRNRPCRLVRRNGQVFEALVSTQVLEWRGERHLFSSVTDISAEMALRGEVTRAEKRLSVIFRHSPMPIIISHFDSSRIIDANLEAEQLLGRSVEELREPTRAPLLIDPGLREERRRRLAAGEVIRKWPVEIKRADGGVRKLLLSSALVADEGERFAIIMAHDVTAEAAAREALDRSRQRFETIFRESPFAIFITDFDTATVIDTNGAAAELLGFSSDEARGMSTGVYYTELAERDRVRAAMEQHGRVQNLPIRLRHRAGAVLELLLSAVVFREAEVRYSLNMVVDITAETRARAALRESEARFATAFNFMPIGMTITRVADGRILEVNQADERVLGYTPGETIGRTTLETGAWDSPADRQRFVDLLRRDGRVLGYDARMRNKSGALVDTRIFAERIELGGEPCILAATLNVTEEKRQEAEIRALNEGLETRVRERTAEVENANAELEAFSYSVSHDLRAPVRAASGFLQLLREDIEAALTDQQRDYVTRIARSCERMNELIEGLLALARIGRRQIARAPLDLDQVAAQVLVDLRLRQPQRRVTCEVSPGLMAHCDPELARILLENLLGNAWKYTAKCDEAHISVGPGVFADGTPAYVVADNGAGFDMRYVERLFKPFQRLHSDAEFEGSGIGLSTVHRIVTRHGGRIEAHSVLGQGATFRFTLGFVAG